MEAMATPHSAAAEASLGADTARFVPPAHPAEMAFRSWLEERTPAGAPTLEVAPPDDRAPLHLPQTRRAVLSSAPRRGRRRRGAAPAVHAACMVDLEGLSPRQLADSALFGFSTERAARQHVRDGRFVAAELGLWPWAVVGGQALARSWWVDPRFALALQEWAAVAPHPLGVASTVQPLRPRRFMAAARLPVA